MKHLVALVTCLSAIQIASTFSVFDDDLFDIPDTDGLRVRRAVKSPRTLAMLERLTNTPGWKFLDRNRCGMSSTLVYSRRKRSTSNHKLQLNVTSRIVGGSEVKPGQYPWMARILYQAGPVISVGCGGALVSTWHVITAAHCVAELPEGITISSIRVGPDGNSQSMGAESSLYHSKYNQRTMQNDIALIKLKTSVKFNDYVGPVCLPLGELAEKTFAGQSAVVAGWGKTESARSSDKLLMVNVPIMENSICRTKITSYKIMSSHLCAGGVKGKDSCNGDSGGPLFLMDRQDGLGSPLRNTIIGVVSYGPNECGTDGTPGVYTRVSFYLPWILTNMK